MTKNLFWFLMQFFQSSFLYIYSVSCCLSRAPAATGPYRCRDQCRLAPTGTGGYLVRSGSWLKTETENGVFLLRCGKHRIKTVKRYSFWLRCRVFLSPNRGNGRSRNGTGRLGTVLLGQGDNFGSTAVFHERFLG